MSKDDSMKEFIFNLVLLKHNDLLKPFIGPNKLDELERYHVDNTRIDIVGRTIGKDIPVYVETQRTTSDNDHFNQIKQLIETVDGGIIIWIASSHAPEQLEKMDELSAGFANKSIKIIAISFPKALSCNVE